MMPNKPWLNLFICVIVGRLEICDVTVYSAQEQSESLQASVTPLSAHITLVSIKEPVWQLVLSY